LREEESRKPVGFRLGVSIYPVLEESNSLNIILKPTG